MQKLFHLNYHQFYVWMEIFRQGTANNKCFRIRFSRLSKSVFVKTTGWVGKVQVKIIPLWEKDLIRSLPGLPVASESC